MFAAAAVAWLVVNVPIMLAAFDSWSRFYTFNQERPVDWGSIFFLAGRKGMDSVNDVPTLNLMGEAGFAVLAVAIALLVLAAPRRPRLPQVLFLVLAAFLLTNKVWSPQYILWLLPLVVLARPKLPAYALWQAGEIIYFFGIWWYLLAGSLEQPGMGLSDTLSAVFAGHAPAIGINDNVYFIALLARFLTVLLMATLVVVDVLVPEPRPRTRRSAPTTRRAVSSTEPTTASSCSAGPLRRPPEWTAGPYDGCRAVPRPSRPLGADGLGRHPARRPGDLARGLPHLDVRRPEGLLPGPLDAVGRRPVHRDRQVRLPRRPRAAPGRRAPGVLPRPADAAAHRPRRRPELAAVRAADQLRRAARWR